MFYDSNKIESKLNCSSCSIKYDIPKILPCGDTICNRCETKMIKVMKSYTCISCKKQHPIEVNGLPVNKIIKELLNLESEEIYRGALHEETKKLLIKNNESIKELRAINENPNEIVEQECNNLIDRVDINCESVISLVNQYRDEFFTEINLYRKNCIDNIKASQAETKDFVEKCELENLNSLQSLRKSCIDDSTIEEIKRRIEVKDLQIRDEIKLYKNRILSDRLLVFEENVKNISKDDFGSLVYHESASRISIKAVANGRFVSADNNGNSPLIANRNVVGSWETFKMKKYPDGYITLMSLSNNKYVTAENYGNSPLIANRDIALEWELFLLISNCDGTYSFQAKINSKYVCADYFGFVPLKASKNHIQGWEKFYINYL
jgi:hypothetical protein